MAGTVKRLGSAMALGALMAVTACGGGEANRTDTTAAGDVATDTMAGAPAAASAAGTRTAADIMSAISASNASEITAGELAATKATNADVKAFARMMVTDHRAMMKEGSTIAQRLGVAAATGGDKAGDMTDDANDDAKDLRDATGADFDKKYMEQQVNAHEKTLGLLNEVKDDTRDPELQTLANRAIPKVQAHLDRARQIRDQLDR